MVTYLDECVGRITALLDELGVADNTIVIFTSDNGTAPNGGCDRRFFRSLGELRGTKMTVYEGGIRVPTIVRWPGRVRPGSVSQAHGAIWDLLPTLTAVAEAPAPSRLDGVDLSAAWEKRSAPRREYLYFEYPEADQQQAVVLERFKGVRTHLREGNRTVQLYDLDNDPGEMRDVAAQHPGVVARVEAIMREARQPSTLFPIPALDDVEG